MEKARSYMEKGLGVLLLAAVLLLGLHFLTVWFTADYLEGRTYSALMPYSLIGLVIALALALLGVLRGGDDLLTILPALCLGTVWYVLTARAPLFIGLYREPLLPIMGRENFSIPVLVFLGGLLIGACCSLLAKRPLRFAWKRALGWVGVLATLVLTDLGVGALEKLRLDTMFTEGTNQLLNRVLVGVAALVAALPLLWITKRGERFGGIVLVVFGVGMLACYYSVEFAKTLASAPVGTFERAIRSSLAYRSNFISLPILYLGFAAMGVKALLPEKKGKAAASGDMPPEEASSEEAPSNEAPSDNVVSK